MEAVQAKQLQLHAFLIRNLSLAEVRWINIINCKGKILISSPCILSQEIEKNKTKLKIFVHNNDCNPPPQPKALLTSEVRILQTSIAIKNRITHSPFSDYNVCQK